MKPLYRIHSANPVQIAVEAEHQGRKIAAQIMALEVEFLPVGHAGGTVTQRFAAPDADSLAALRENYPVGHLFEMTINAVDAEA